MYDCEKTSMNDPRSGGIEKAQEAPTTKRKLENAGREKGDMESSGGGQRRRKNTGKMDTGEAKTQRKEGRKAEAGYRQQGAP